MELVGKSGQKLTASDVVEGLTNEHDIKMISSIPVPEKVVKAFFVSNTLNELGYSLESELVKKLALDYLKCYVSKKGKNNRSDKILSAIASLFKMELEDAKAKKGMFSK